MHDHLDALGAGGERVDGVVLRRARVDDERLAVVAGDLDLGEERALLVVARRAVAVVVEPGLADRATARVRASSAISSAARRRSPSATFGWRPTAANTSSKRSAAASAERRPSESIPMVRIRFDARLARGRHQLVLGRGAVVEVGVRVDHCGFGNRGASSPTAAPPGPSPYSAALSSSRSSPSAASSLAGRLGHVGREQHGHDAQALGEQAQRRLELAAAPGSLASFHGRLLLDVAVEPPHARARCGRAPG